jgi:hypothetical protein
MTKIKTLIGTCIAAGALAGVGAPMAAAAPTGNHPGGSTATAPHDQHPDPRHPRGLTLSVGSAILLS